MRKISLFFIIWVLSLSARGQESNTLLPSQASANSNPIDEKIIDLKPIEPKLVEQPRAEKKTKSTPGKESSKNEKKPKTNATKESEKKDTSIIEDIAIGLEQQREILSEQLLETSNDIDVYFSNTNYLKTRNATNLRLSNESNFIEDTGYENNFDIALRLKLPRSQDKLQLELDQQVNELRDGGSDYTDYTVVERTRRENGDTKAGLNYYEKFNDTEVRLTAGFDYKHKLIPWTNLKFKNDIFLSKSKKHYFQIINDFYGETLEGTEHHANVNYNYQLTKHLVLRQVNESRYRDFDNTLEVSNGVHLYHFINARNSLAYVYNMYSRNPSALTTYFLDRHIVNVNFRRRLYKKHYYASVTPGVIIPKDKSWEVLTSFQFKIEIYFGNP